MAVRTIRNGTLSIYDATSPTPLSVTATFDGEISWTVTKNPIPMLDRGVLSHFRPGNEACCEVSFNILCQGLTDVSTATVYNALTKTGPCASVPWLSQTASLDDVWTVKIVVTEADPLGTDNEKITFAKCALTRIEFAEAEEGNRLTFTCIDLEETPTIAAA